jgi:hypothetical protein
MRMAVYRDADGRPGARISQSWEAVLPAGAWGRWITLSTEPVTFEAGRYWIVMHTGSTGGVLRNFADGGVNWFGNADSYNDGPSPTFGAGNSGNGTLSAFASYEPGPIVIRTLGRTDVGTKPSQGLTANFIRGSVFELHDPRAILTGLHAYLDGNGGASGVQKVRMVMYELTGSPPNHTGARMVESAEVSIAAGTPPGWVHFPVPLTNIQPPFAPGFLIMLHSGDTGGIVRAYGGDGPANWLGNADAYANLSEQFFEVGQAISGNGTLSLHATYSTPAD